MTMLLCLVAALLSIACSADDRAPFGYTPGDQPGRLPANPCATPQTGCACDEPEATVQCGEVERKGSTSVTCAYGSRTCTDGRWSACVTTSTRVQSTSSHRTLALGSATSCANECDPFCTDITDSHTGLTPDADAGIDVTDGGISLVRKEVTSTGTKCDSLSITANPSTLTVTKLSPLSPKTVQLTPSVSPSSCYPGTPPVVWAIDRFDIATISATGTLTLVSPLAVPIVVTAYAGSLTATTTVQVNLNVLDTSSAPATAVNKFTSATGPADAMTVLYPYANTVFPLGLLPPLVQWRPTTAATAVKVSLRYPATGAAKFSWSAIAPENETMWLDPPTNSIPLAAGPRFTIPEAVWKAFEQTAKGEVGAIAVQRWSSGLGLRGEVVTPIRFATGQLKGTMYYQSYGTNLVKGPTAGATGNFSSTFSPQTYGGGKRFGAATLAITPGATYPTVVAGYYSSSDGPGCRVCHSGSASGTVLVSQVYNSTDSRLYRLGVDAADGGLTFNGTDNGKFSWPAIYPDGTFIFGNSGPPPQYNTTPPPGGLDQSAWIPASGGTPAQAPPNALYSLVPGKVGDVIASTGIPSALRAALPVFSPDGKKLAFNHYAGTVSTTSGNKTGDKRSLAVMDFNVNTKTFSNLRRLWDEPTTPCSTLSSDPCTNVWPSFLPDNSGIVYEREVFNNGRVAGSGHSDFGGTRNGCDGTGACGDDGTKADLWWVTLGATPVRARLNAANGYDSAGNLTIPTGANGHTAAVEGILNYEPTLSPQEVGGYFWVAFTSRRLYGNVATVNPWWSDPRYKPIGGGNGPTTKKIWVAAIKPGAAPGTDPSFPAFYLPGQELLAGNSKAFWSLEACKAPSSTRSAANLCETNLDCCGAPTTAICSLQTPITDPPVRHCIPLNGSMCIPDNSATQCSTHAECCGFSAGSRCANGVCQLPPPLKLFDIGTYTRDFEADCPPEQHPVWKVFEWKATLPATSSIVFTAATAATEAGLDTATEVAAGTATPPGSTEWATNPVQIDTNLAAAGLKSQEYLRIRMTLNPSSDKLQTPLLTDWRIRYDCVDAE